MTSSTELMPKRLRIALIGSLLALGMAGWLVSGLALADVAPPKAPPGANPDTGTVDTQVRMVEEIVIITVQEEIDPDQMGTARVWAEFQMRNQGPASETLMVRFPTSYNDGFSGYPEIEDLRVYVDNQAVPTTPLNLEEEPEHWEDPVKWAEFEVVFPPGEMVEIEVDYTLRGTGEYPFVSYAYVLETGAGWQGTIGSAEIIVRLPYPANAKTVFIDSSPGWGGTTQGAVLEENEVSWFFEDFEPGYEHNISIALVWPSAWHKVEQELANLDRNPQDGEAWGRLGKVYKELALLRKWLRDDPGGAELAVLSQDAYQRALELLPDDALWHAGYADLMLWMAKWDYYQDPQGLALMIRSLEGMALAYALDPDQPYIQERLDWYYPPGAVDSVGDSYDFLWLTQTPTLVPPDTPVPPTETEVVDTPTLQPTDPPPTQTPSARIQPEQDDKVEEPQEEGRKLPLCGSVALFPLVLVGFVVLKKRDEVL